MERIGFGASSLFIQRDFHSLYFVYFWSINNLLTNNHKFPKEKKKGVGMEGEERFPSKNLQD